MRGLEPDGRLDGTEESASLGGLGGGDAVRRLFFEWARGMAVCLVDGPAADEPAADVMAVSGAAGRMAGDGAAGEPSDVQADGPAAEGP
jgi:hypothetical protein